jgi:hypothetical protein
MKELTVIKNAACETTTARTHSINAEPRFGFACNLATNISKNGITCPGGSRLTVAKIMAGSFTIKDFSNSCLSEDWMACESIACKEVAVGALNGFPPAPPAEFDLREAGAVDGSRFMVLSFSSRVGSLEFAAVAKSGINSPLASRIVALADSL